MHHNNDLDALAFQSGMPAAIGRFDRTGSGRVRQRRRHGPRRSFLRNVTALCLVVVTLGLSAGSAAGQAVPAVTGVTSVAAGGSHSCVVTSDHHARCFGLNDHGQLGRPASTEVRRAVVVPNAANTRALGGVLAIATGDAHTCALVQGGEVRCWGADSAGQLGTGNFDEQHHPVAVLSPAGTGHLRNVTQISAAAFSTCARQANGHALCWGENQTGQLGVGDDVDRSRPTFVKAVGGTGVLTDVTQVDAGAYHGCARLSTGQARCWGTNGYGELGRGATGASPVPVVVRNTGNNGPLVRVRSISAGVSHTCATLADGTGRCWGANGAGGLGDGTDNPRFVPVVVYVGASHAPLSGIANIEAGASHSCALLTNGQVRCWGSNDFGQVGNGATSPQNVYPLAVRNKAGTGNLVGVAQVRANALHTCVRLTNGQARCWGFGYYGQLGDGGAASTSLPQVVTELVN